MSKEAKNDPAYIEISMLADRIIRMMDECRSAYAPAKKHIIEARKSIMVQPQHAAKEMRRGFRLVEDEFMLVGDFQRCEASFPVNVKMSSNGGVQEISGEFRSLVRAGDFKKAGKQLEALKKLMDSRGVCTNLALSSADNVVKDGKVTLRLSNVCDSDITIDRISASCFDASLKKGMPMIRTIKRGATAEFVAEFDGEYKEVNTISVSVGYQVGMDEYSDTVCIKVFAEKEGGE